MQIQDFLNKIIYIGIFFLIIALLIVGYTFFLNQNKSIGLRINIIGPNEVKPLENYSYNLSLENKSNQTLKDVVLKIYLSDGAFFTNNPQEKETSYSLGIIEKGKTINQSLEIFFLNEGQLKENLRIVLNYKIENKDNIFEKEENFQVLVKSPPIETQVFVPDKFYVFQKFQISFRILNLTSKKLDNLEVIIGLPTEFVLISSFPQNDKNYFHFPSLQPSETKDISLIGKIQSFKSNKLLSIGIKFKFLNETYSLNEKVVRLNLLDSPIDIELASSPSGQTVPIGGSLSYEIIVRNKSPYQLKDNEIKVSFNELFDINSLSSDGYFSQLDRYLYWNSRNKPELYHLDPGEEVRTKFNIKLFRSYPILGETKKNFLTKVKAEFSSKDIPLEIKGENPEIYTIEYEDSKKVIGAIQVSQNLIYNDEYFPGVGPFPLEPGTTTYLSWHIYINTIGEDFNNLTLKTKLPIGVDLTGKIGGDAIKDNFEFNKITGEFTYVINRLPANLGFTEKGIDLVFQISITLPKFYDKNSLIIPELNFSTISEFSQILINEKASGIRLGQIAQ